MKVSFCKGCRRAIRSRVAVENARRVMSCKMLTKDEQDAALPMCHRCTTAYLARTLRSKWAA